MQNIKFPLILCLSLLLLACSDQGKDTKQSDTNGPKPTLVTVTQVKQAPIEITETTIGSLESLTDPTLAAEVAARVVDVRVNVGDRVKQGQLVAILDATDFGTQRNEAQSEVARIQAQLENQNKIVARNLTLVDKKFISQNAVDNDIAQQNVLKEQLKGAQSRVGSINHTASKTNIFAPVSGIVEKKIVDKGDFVSVGDPLVQIISTQQLRAHLPFPEQIGAKLKSGLKIRLTTPLSPKTVETVIHDLKPMLTEGNRSIDVIADVINQADWQPGASVTGTVVLSTRPNAVMIPEQSLVLRPAGEVVYVVRDNTAYQAIVKTGLRQNGFVEILAGLQPNETIVIDGAGFLTDKTSVKVSR
jgi:membrane fusion protein (multidrug efflux system)